MTKAVIAQLALRPGNAKGLKRQFKSISGVSASLTGRQLLALSQLASIRSITRDARLRASAYSNYQGWVQSVEANQYWAEGARVRRDVASVVGSTVQR